MNSRIKPLRPAKPADESRERKMLENTLGQIE